MSSFHIKRGDTSPALVYALEPAGEVILTGASAVFSMRPRTGGALVVDRAPAVIVTATGSPTLRHDWAPGDTALAGAHWAEFEVTYADGAIETLPNDGHITVIITQDLA